MKQREGWRVILVSMVAFGVTNGFVLVGYASEAGSPISSDAAVQTGGWGNAVAIAVPRARAGLSPSVQIGANHRVIGGVLGAGWTLTATSVIKRFSSTGGTPNLTPVSSYQVDVQWMVRVDGPGSPHRQTETYSNGARFRYDSVQNI